MALDDFFGLMNTGDEEEDKMFRQWVAEDDKRLLYAELYISHLKSVRGGKRKTYDTHGFEACLSENLWRLTEALYYKEYHPSRGTAHIINKPVKREIFAAPYVDRIVHRWTVDQISEYWEPRLIYDSYSCRKEKGTAFGIKRLQHHICSVMGEHPGQKVYVVKMDISGYFMHIKRDILFDKIDDGLSHQFKDYELDPETGFYLPKKVKNGQAKRYGILRNAVSEIVFDDPVRDVKIQGSYEDWRGLPEDKSLFAQPKGQGMVIGNYTSQSFSNVYLDALDWFVMMDLKYKHYGRYVDDFFIVVTESQLAQAKRDVEAIATFLQGYNLSLNRKKTKVYPAWQGVPFLGMVVFPSKILPDERITKNFYSSAMELISGDGSVESIQSYLGMLMHYDSGRLVQKIMGEFGN